MLHLRKIILNIVITAIVFTIVSCNLETKKSITANKLQNVANDTAQKVILIMLDGVRWQELFTGADSLLINHKEFTNDIHFLNKKFWRKTASERRKLLMPFFWNTIAEKGNIYGNRHYNNKVNVTNNLRFSYPGYSEVLCGFADDVRVNSNEKENNPNKTILELINNLPKFKGKVGAFGSWDVFPYIINEERANLYVNAGYREAKDNDITEKEKYLNDLQKQAVRPWESVRQDVFTHNYALEFIKKKNPKLLFISYGETDDFAHDGDYTHYLLSIKNTDAMIKQLWNYCQSTPYYQGKTTFIITTDHGRGVQPIKTWKDHGKDIPVSGETWIAFIGAKVEAKGEIKENGQLYNSQIATTIQQLLGVKVLSKKANSNVLPMIK